jgi:dTDP-4-dehydrorhamnose 3,5-epimerase
MPALEVETFPLQGLLHITPRRFSDSRGFFCETYNARDFAEIGVTAVFIQDNQSLSHDKGIVRGMHFQIPPFAQAKLVRVLRGSIYDVAVDLRAGSQTYGKSAAALLTVDNGNQLYIPSGFAHGYCTLEPETEVLYKVDAAYSREHERGLRWDDPALEIAWPVAAQDSILLERDWAFPLLGDLPLYFS